MIVIDIQNFIPAGKDRPRFVRATGRIYSTAKTEKYEDTIRTFALQVMRGQPRLNDGPLVMRVTAHFPIPKSWSKRDRECARTGTVRPTGKPDADNILKSACDALNGVVFADDAQVVVALVAKHYGDIPSLRIEVDRALT